MPGGDLEKVQINDDHPNRIAKIGAQLPPQIRDDLTNFLCENAQVFAWSYEDMPGIDPEIISHRLSIDPAFKPICQKCRAYDAERYATRWTSSRRLVSFVKLTIQACPKDSFSLPRIDQLIDSTAGHELLSFMDAYSGYNQIMMYPPNQEHTSFITDRGLYCYKVMPFDLKNAGATYQRLVNQMFANQIGKNMEVYVDDMLVKNVTVDHHIQDLVETFEVLTRYEMRLNPAKCAFEVSSGKFLGFMVSFKWFELGSNLLSIDRREQTAIGCFAYLFYYGRLGDIRGRPSSLFGYNHSPIHSLNPLAFHSFCEVHC
ncbi:unnamed protein product [Prunus armeniaca]